MGMMGKMRSLAPWFIITVGGLFVLFMVLSDSNLASFVGQQRNIVGSINGYDVSYQEFAQTVERARNIQQQQGREIDESQMAIFRDQVWDAIVSQKLLEDKIDEFGITVTDEEIRDVLLGPNPPADLRQSFIDSTGAFNREMYENALFDPRNKEILIQLEDRIRQEQMQAKLQDLLFASITVSEDELQRKFIEQNIKMDAEYAFVNSANITDSTVEATDSEIKAYYNEHKDEYKTEEKRKVRYVLFPKQPSAADTAGILEDLTAILTDLQRDTSSFKTYAEIYSEEPYSLDSVALNLIPDGAKELVANAKVGEIVGPALTSEGCIVYKVNGKERAKEPLVKASHILIKGDTQEAKGKANEIYNELINGADFAETAKLKSEDTGSAVHGGDVGWFGKGQMVKEFTDACYSGRIGAVQRPVKTRYGYHIIKVTDKNDRKYIVEKIVKKIVPSGTTLDNLYNQASDFAYLAENNNFDSEAELLKYEVRESYSFNEESKTVPGLGQNTAMIKFAFENSVGATSEVFNLPTGYVVATVSEVEPAGYKDLESVSAQIKNKIIGEKKIEMAKEKAMEIYNAIASSNDLNKAKEVYSKAKVDVAKEFSATGRIPGVGQEYAFADYALTGELNKISQPVVGTRGCYLIKVLNRTKFDSTSYTIQKYTLRSNIERQKKSRIYTEWIAKVKDEADIEDNRYRFWR